MMRILSENCSSYEEYRADIEFRTNTSLLSAIARILVFVRKYQEMVLFAMKNDTHMNNHT